MNFDGLVIDDPVHFASVFESAAIMCGQDFKEEITE